MVKTVDEDFEKATDQNLPVVNYWMLLKFFTNQAFIAPEIRNVKARRSARASYSENALAWVQVKRDGWLCHMKGEMTPETRVRVKNYSVHCLINERRCTILKTICEDCAASEEGCKHQIAFVFWLHRRSEEPAKTEVTCYWRKSVLSTVGRTIRSLAMETVAPPKVVLFTSGKKKAFFSEAMELCESSSPSLLFSHSSDLEQSYSLFHLMAAYVETPEPHSAEEFIDFCKTVMTKEGCDFLAEETAEQSQSTLWFELKQGRLTASRVEEASRCSTKDGSLVDSIFGAVKLKSTKEIERGIRLEPEVLECVTRMTRIEYRKFAEQGSTERKKMLLKKARALKMRRTGLIMKRDNPIFGASPDGLLGSYVVEVKCPSTKDTFKRYFLKDGSQPARRYRGQLQLQMFLSGYEKALFCVADPHFENNKQVKIVKVLFDSKYCEDMMSKALNFWASNIYPSLYKAVKK